MNCWTESPNICCVVASLSFALVMVLGELVVVVLVWVIEFVLVVGEVRGGGVLLVVVVLGEALLVEVDLLVAALSVLVVVVVPLSSLEVLPLPFRSQIPSSIYIFHTQVKTSLLLDELTPKDTFPDLWFI